MTEVSFNILVSSDFSITLLQPAPIESGANLSISPVSRASGLWRSTSNETLLSLHRYLVVHSTLLYTIVIGLIEPDVGTGPKTSAGSGAHIRRDPTMNRLLTAAVACALLSAPMMAHARDVSMKLDLAGVDTHTTAGAKDALVRIAKAATKACELNATGSRLAKTDSQCIAELTRQAVEAIGSTELSALHKAPPSGLDAVYSSHGRIKGVR
jgi:UrcA family protein